MRKFLLGVKIAIASKLKYVKILANDIDFQ